MTHCLSWLLYCVFNIIHSCNELRVSVRTFHDFKWDIPRDRPPHGRKQGAHWTHPPSWMTEFFTQSVRILFLVDLHRKITNPTRTKTTCTVIMLIIIFHFSHGQLKNSYHFSNAHWSVWPLVLLAFARLCPNCWPAHKSLPTMFRSHCPPWFRRSCFIIILSTLIDPTPTPWFVQCLPHSIWSSNPDHKKARLSYQVFGKYVDSAKGTQGCIIGPKACNNNVDFTITQMTRCQRFVPWEIKTLQDLDGFV